MELIVGAFVRCNANRRAAQMQPNGHAGGGAGAAAVAAASGLVSFVGAAARLVEANRQALVDR